MEVVLGLPATRAYLEKNVSNFAVVLPLSHGGQVAERSVDDCHINLVGEVTRGDPTEGPAVDSDFAPEL